MMNAHSSHFYGHIENEVKRYLVTLLLEPARFHTNTRELTGRVMSRLAYDDSSQGPRKGDTAIETLTQMSVSGPIVNTVTPLWHIGDFFRYNPWRKFEVQREVNLKAWWLELLRIARARFLRGELPSDTWAYRYFEGVVNEGNAGVELTSKDEEMASCMMGFQCLVGVVTLSGPMLFFLMCMALHPEWLKKCQEEIDRVCGDRTPTVDDSPNLPTVRACVKETIRWRSGVPLGMSPFPMPRQAEANDNGRRSSSVRKGLRVHGHPNHEGYHRPRLRMVSPPHPISPILAS